MSSSPPFLAAVARVRDTYAHGDVEDTPWKRRVGWGDRVADLARRTISEARGWTPEDIAAVSDVDPWTYWNACVEHQGADDPVPFVIARGDVVLARPTEMRPKKSRGQKLYALMAAGASMDDALAQVDGVGPVGEPTHVPHLRLIRCDGGEP